MATTGGVKGRKRVEASSEPQTAASLLRAKDGSAFARCEECNKNVPVALISMHSCSLEAKIKLNLEAQLVEMSTESKKKPADRKKLGTTGPKAKKAKTEKKVKKGKDPSMPKRPPTAFFLFMDDFRKAYKEAHPDSKDVKVVAKEGGEKWRNLTEEEKKVYQDKASDLKMEYAKALESHNAEDEDGDRGSEKEVEGASDGE
ncbi:high mobility group B protein 7-like [Juglans microcarpa x Juglans regia]|uniref:high mobility group B protein 7-like n=1 Tax=Juglans microcarpa x Juglans regia TaxID=2249226 RepID=UPI001B7F64A8|nr:high mobility group B protein 7-like [Juglans microcarpa x Juglans regia]